MHELSIAVAIVESAEEEAQRHGERVDAVYVKVGALSGVVKDALLFSWDLACADTSLAGARLEIEEIPVRRVVRSVRRGKESGGRFRSVLRRVRRDRHRSEARA